MANAFSISINQSVKIYIVPLQDTYSEAPLCLFGCCVVLSDEIACYHYRHQELQVAYIIASF